MIDQSMIRAGARMSWRGPWLAAAAFLVAAQPVTAQAPPAAPPSPAAAYPRRAPSHPDTTLVLQDYAQAPRSGMMDGTTTMGEVARINYMRDDPAHARFFVNDLNGKLYLLDKKSHAFTTFLDFDGSHAGGLFPKFTYQQTYAAGLISVTLDPDYARNGRFYTIHMEDVTRSGSSAPRSDAVAGLDLSGYATTAPVVTPSAGQPLTRDLILVEWTERHPGSTTFAGRAREILRIEVASPQHPMSEISFNPAARRGDPDWRVMYIGVGDALSGESPDARKLNPQRLDVLVGKVLRIIPDLREHATTSQIGSNGRYRIPDDNPFASMPGARGEIWAFGIRNPHRLDWYLDPTQQRAPTLLAFVIGSNQGPPRFETIDIVKKGANYGWPLREGGEAKFSDTLLGHVSPDNRVPLRLSDQVTRGTIRIDDPVIRYATSVEGDAIASGFVYSGHALPALRGKLLFGDITTGRIWSAAMSDLFAADDGKPLTFAPIAELDVGLRAIVDKSFLARGGTGILPGRGRAAGGGRIDMRLVADAEGEIYILTKSDGMIRKVVATAKKD